HFPRDQQQDRDRHRQEQVVLEPHPVVRGKPDHQEDDDEAEYLDDVAPVEHAYCLPTTLISTRRLAARQSPGSSLSRSIAPRPIHLMRFLLLLRQSRSARL